MMSHEQRSLLKQFRLGDWLVDVSANRISRDGQEIKFEGRVMDVLVYLVEHQGELVTREQLEQAAWGGTVVGYEALTGCIAKLRKLLGDDPQSPRYIETISKKGYRLVAEVSIDYSNLPVSRKKLTRRNIWQIVLSVFVIGLLAIILIPATPSNYDDQKLKLTRDKPSIVVLPFTNLDNTNEKKYLNEGITADIATALSKLSGLVVISSSLDTSKFQATDIKNIASTLGAQYVLQGSIRTTDDQLRVNASLIDAASEAYLWSEKYDRQMKNIFEVQDDITARIVKSLSIKLTEEEKQRTAKKYTRSIEAYDDFLHGQSLYVRFNKEDNQQARKYFQQAIDRDENFARAYSAMALTYVTEQRYGWGKDNAELLAKALELATNATFLDKELPQAQWVLAYVSVFRQEYEKAMAVAERAIKLNPNYADSYVTLAICKIHFGLADEALALIKKAMLLNPQYPAGYGSVLGQAYYLDGQYESAIPVLRDVVDRNISLLTAQIFLIATLSKADQLDEARWAAEQLKTNVPEFNVNNIAEMLPIKEPAAVKDITEHLQRAGL